MPQKKPHGALADSATTKAVVYGRRKFAVGPKELGVFKYGTERKNVLGDVELAAAKIIGTTPTGSRVGIPVKISVKDGEIVEVIQGGLPFRARKRRRTRPDPRQVEGVPTERVLVDTAVNMERSIKALGSALEEVETPVSPQLARSIQATENLWRAMEREFKLLTATEVSAAVGSKSPNRSYASEQHAAGKLLAVKRAGAYRYPGFQIDRQEHKIRPVMADLLSVAKEAGRSESSLALWMLIRTGYLDGARPVDQLASPNMVVEAARHAFNVQW